MTTTYTAIFEIQDSNGRFANLTNTPVVTAYRIDTKASLGAATMENITTGLYKASISAADGLDVIFYVAVHADDQSAFKDAAGLHERSFVEEILTDIGTIDGIVDDILVDTGTTLPASIDAIATWAAANISASVTAGTITDIRGNDWDIDIPDLTLDDNLIQFVLKRSDSYSDAQALLFIDTDTGLITVNGATATEPTDAALSYAGTTLTVTVKPDITKLMPIGTWVYGIQSITAGGVVSEVYGGSFTITADKVWAVE